MRYDLAYSNADFIPGGKDYPARWEKAASAFRSGLGDRAQLALRYGSAERNWFDLFLPEDQPAGLMIFIHGGYWLRFGPRDFSHLAAGALARGWAVAMPAYTLAPQASIAQIRREIEAALPQMADKIGGPVVLCGHSAGGHLAARMVGADIVLPAGIDARLLRVMPISPVADLRPLIETSMNRDLGLDAAMAAAESPALIPLRPGKEVHVWVGAEERPAFLNQARRLGNAWASPVTVEAGRHHFDVIEGLESPDSPLLNALLGAPGVV